MATALLLPSTRPQNSNVSCAAGLAIFDDRAGDGLDTLVFEIKEVVGTDLGYAVEIKPLAA
jgi:hypothetical protein